MGKIKGWKKIGEDEWQNEVTGMILSVEDFGGMGFFTSSKMPGAEATEFYETTDGDVWARKQDVVDATVKFMKKNP